MDCVVEKHSGALSPEQLVESLGPLEGVVLLRSSLFERTQGRFSYVVARPFLTFRSTGSACELRWGDGVTEVCLSDPWRQLESLMARYEMVDHRELPLPLGGCFGFWGYELKNFIEPKLSQRACNDLGMPDCHLGFYGSLVAFDHELDESWIIATGLDQDGSREEGRARKQVEFWQQKLASCGAQGTCAQRVEFSATNHSARVCGHYRLPESRTGSPDVFSNFTPEEFVASVQRAKRYIEAGDIYQINLSQRLSASPSSSAWTFFQTLSEVSPAPFAAYLDAADFELVSSSPELFLRLSGSQVRTRPIKGTRPRDPDPARDAVLSQQLQSSSKEAAELVMITDLLRNDLGKVCEFGSVQVPELSRLEHYAQVQHLVSTVEGRLRDGVTHLAALAACFPGGSVTGAPKVRAMELIDELEPVFRGPYTGAFGYLGFNRQSQLSILIRTVLQKSGVAYFQVGAGIVADSDPEAEYLETLDKARGFLESLQICACSHDRFYQRRICS